MADISEEAIQKRVEECAKCGTTSNDDSSLTFHRFPLPSARDTLRAKVWAKFCFPNDDWSSEKSLTKLYQQHKMICSKHFDQTSFTNHDRKKLSKFAIPIKARSILAKLRNERLYASFDAQKIKGIPAKTIATAFAGLTQSSNSEESSDKTSQESHNLDVVEEVIVKTFTEVMPRKQKIIKANVIKVCAVIECDSDSTRNNSLTFKLFPSTKSLAIKWLKNLENMIPNLLLQRVHNLYICEKHFEDRFLLAPGRLDDYAYPTLFSPKEIATDVPENFEYGEYRTYNDHGYCMFKKDVPDSYLTQDIKFQYKRKEKSGTMDLTKNTENVPITDGGYPTNKKDVPDSFLTQYIKYQLKTKEKNGTIDITRKNTENAPITDGIENITKTQNNNTIRDLKDSKGQPIFQILNSGPPKGSDYSCNIDTEMNFDNDTTMDYDDNTSVNSPQITNTDATNFTSPSRTALISAQSTKMPVSTKFPNLSRAAIISAQSTKMPVSTKFPNLSRAAIISAQSTKMPVSTKFPNLSRAAIISAQSTNIPDSTKILESKYKQSLKQVKKLENMIKKRNEIIKRMKFDRKACFEKLTKDVENPLAKKFLWMQIRSAPKNACGRRFTDEEKTICLYIQKQSPQCYRMLSKIFTVPSYKVLRRFIKTELALKNKVDS